MDPFLSMYFLFEVLVFKNVWNTIDNISWCKNGHLKQKEPQPPAATLGFFFTSRTLTVNNSLRSIDIEPFILGFKFIFLSFLKSLRLELVNILLVLTVNKIGLDFPLIFLCREESIKDQKLILVKHWVF